MTLPRAKKIKWLLDNRHENETVQLSFEEVAEIAQAKSEFDAAFKYTRICTVEEAINLIIGRIRSIPLQKEKYA